MATQETHTFFHTFFSIICKSPAFLFFFSVVCITTTGGIIQPCLYIHSYMYVSGCISVCTGTCIVHTRITIAWITDIIRKRGGFSYKYKKKKDVTISIKINKNINKKMYILFSKIDIIAAEVTPTPFNYYIIPTSL